MRLDFGIVWAHGMPYIDEILGMLRQYKDLELVWFKKYTPPDFNIFVEKVYSFDAVPIEHLRAKNKYLNSIGHETYVMLIKNKRPEPAVVGEGEFRHEQCMLMNKFKWQVREMFNPKVNRERTEDHVIHCSDYPSQTERFMKEMNLGDIDSYVSKTPELPWMSYHTGGFSSYRTKEYPVNDLLVGLIYNSRANKQIPLKETPHYKYVSGDKEEYINYWNEWKGIRLTEDHTPQKFDELIDWLTPETYIGMDGMIVVENGRILDGVHRASILAFKGAEKILVLDTIVYGN